MQRRPPEAPPLLQLTNWKQIKVKLQGDEPRGELLKLQGQTLLYVQPYVFMWTLQDEAPPTQYNHSAFCNATLYELYLWTFFLFCTYWVGLLTLREWCWEWRLCSRTRSYLWQCWKVGIQSLRTSLSVHTCKEICHHHHHHHHRLKDPLPSAFHPLVFWLGSVMGIFTFIYHKKTSNKLYINIKINFT